MLGAAYEDKVTENAKYFVEVTDINGPAYQRMGLVAPLGVCLVRGMAPSELPLE